MSQWHAQIKNDPRWHAARAACLDRDGHACVDCGTTEHLEADHLVPLSVVLADPDTEHLAFDLDNLATRCGPRANGCNQRRGAALDQAGPVRQTWVHAGYPEVVAVVDAGRVF